MTLQFDSVTFTYPRQQTPVLADLTVTFAKGWTGIVGASGRGKSTLLRLAAGELTPDAGHIRRPGPVLYVAQAAEHQPPELSQLVSKPDGLAAALTGRLELQEDWATRWDTLSHGERKRAQIACALWQAPAVLAVDEPTNHVDEATRAFLAGALTEYPGIGLLVSHDRELLDRLCHACLALSGARAVLRPGGYTQARAEEEREQQSLHRRQAIARQELHSLRATAQARRVEADAANARRSRRHLDKGDSDGRAMINLARVSGKDGQAGRLLRQLGGRLQQAQSTLDSLRGEKVRRLGIELRGEPCRRPLLLRLEPTRLPLGPRRGLEVPALQLTSDGRIGVAGPNGSGKSTLLRHLLRHLLLPPERIVYLPQELTSAEARAVVQQVRQLQPAHLGSVLAAIACLGSEPRQLLATDTPSPGELRKLMLALGLARLPHLIVMDEPTNHLDLPSIECLESALGECRCALLLVSHDARFLQRLTRTHWRLAPDTSATNTVRLVETAL